MWQSLRNYVNELIATAEINSFLNPCSRGWKAPYALAVWAAAGPVTVLGPLLVRGLGTLKNSSNIRQGYIPTNHLFRWYFLSPDGRMHEGRDAHGSDWAVPM